MAVMKGGVAPLHAPSTARRLEPARLVEAALVAAAVTALALGWLVYVADRPAGHAALMPSAAVLAVGGLFGALGAWLPSFVHPFAFSLLTAAVLPRSPASVHRVCLGWWAVNVILECLQQPVLARPVAAAASSWFGHDGLAQPLANYLLQGTFDVRDLVAATAGSLAAAAALTVAHRWESRHDA